MKIEIKKKNKGKFTEYCKGKVTNECIRKAKNSGNPKLIKRAVFAENARKWKHQTGGKFPGTKAQYDNVTSIYQSLVDKGVDPQAALELTNQKVAEKGWTGWTTGDNKKFNNVNSFTDHLIDWHSRMYPDSLKVNNFQDFWNSIQGGKHKYNSRGNVYKKELLLTRPGVKKRINFYRNTLGEQPLAFINNQGNWFINKYIKDTNLGQPVAMLNNIPITKAQQGGILNAVKFLSSVKNTIKSPTAINIGGTVLSVLGDIRAGVRNSVKITPKLTSKVQKTSKSKAFKKFDDLLKYTKGEDLPNFKKKILQAEKDTKVIGKVFQNPYTKQLNRNALREFEWLPEVSNMFTKKYKDIVKNAILTKDQAKRIQLFDQARNIV